MGSPHSPAPNAHSTKVRVSSVVREFCNRACSSSCRKSFRVRVSATSELGAQIDLTAPGDQPPFIVTAYPDDGSIAGGYILGGIKVPLVFSRLWQFPFT